MAGENGKLKAIDLFSGAGGFSLGMEKAGIEVVAAVEFDKNIANTYRYNHSETLMINDDIRNIRVSDLDPSTGNIILSEKIDLNSINVIFGGPPCQGFSMSGNRIRRKKSFLEDERNELFLDFYRFVKFVNPSVFIIENVPGILNYDNGRVKDEIYDLFSSIGYQVASKVLSAENYGVPQKRKRAFIIGNNVGLQSEKLFPKPTGNKKGIVTVWDAISDLPSLESGEGMEETHYLTDPQTEYQKLMRRSNGDTIFNHISSAHNLKTLEILKLIKPGQTMKDLPEKYRTKSVHSGAYGRMKKTEPSYTLTTRLNTPSVGRITHPVDNRTITPREAARLQSFPDSYRFLGNITTIGMQIGNSVPPLLAYELGRCIVASCEKD